MAPLRVQCLGALAVLVVLLLCTSAAFASSFRALQDDPEPPVTREVAINFNGYGQYSSTVDFSLTDFTNLDIAKEKAIWTFAGELNFKHSVAYPPVCQYGIKTKAGTEYKSIQDFAFGPGEAPGTYKFEFDVDFSLQEGEDEPIPIRDIESWWIRLFLHPERLRTNAKLSEVTLSKINWFSHATLHEWTTKTPTVTFPFSPTLVAPNAEKYQSFVEFYPVPQASALYNSDDLNQSIEARLRSKTVTNVPTTTATDGDADPARAFRVTFPPLQRELKFETADYYYELFSNATLKAADPAFFTTASEAPVCTINGQAVPSKIYVSYITSNTFIRFNLPPDFTTVPVGTALKIDCTSQIVVHLDAVRNDHLQWDFVGLTPSPTPGGYHEIAWVESWVARPFEINPDFDPEPIDPVQHSFHVITSMGAEHIPFTNLTIDHFPVDAGNVFDLSVEFTSSYVTADSNCLIFLMSAYRDAKGEVQKLRSTAPCSVSATRHLVAPITFPSPADSQGAELMDFQVDITLFPESMGDSWKLVKLYATSHANEKTYLLNEAELAALSFPYNRPLALPAGDEAAIVFNYYSASRVKKHADTKGKWSENARQFDLKVNNFQAQYTFDQLIIFSSAAQPIKTGTAPTPALKIHHPEAGKLVECPVFNFNDTHKEISNDKYGFALAKLSPLGDYLQVFVSGLRAPIKRNDSFTIYCPDVWVEANQDVNSGSLPWSWAITAPLKDHPEYFESDAYVTSFVVKALADGSDGASNPYKFEEDEAPSKTKYIFFGVMLAAAIILIAAYFGIRRYKAKKNNSPVQPTNLLNESEYANLE
jgi:hypothetical protein